MNCIVTRDSVCAADDFDFPHRHKMAIPRERGVEGLVETIASSGYLPRTVAGGATWCISSGIPLAVVARQWPEPKPVRFIPFAMDELDIRGGVVYCHVSYYAQQDPDLVLDILSKLSPRSS